MLGSGEAVTATTISLSVSMLTLMSYGSRWAVTCIVFLTIVISLMPRTPSLLKRWKHSRQYRPGAGWCALLQYHGQRASEPPRRHRHRPCARAVWEQW